MMHGDGGGRHGIHLQVWLHLDRFHICPLLSTQSLQSTPRDGCMTEYYFCDPRQSIDIWSAGRLPSHSLSPCICKSFRAFFVVQSHSLPRTRDRVLFKCVFKRLIQMEIDSCMWHLGSRGPGGLEIDLSWLRDPEDPSPTHSRPNRSQLLKQHKAHSSCFAPDPNIKPSLPSWVLSHLADFTNV